MSVHNLESPGVRNGAQALWRAHRERRSEVPYVTMVTPGAPVLSSASSAPPEPEQRCLCDAMTVKTGAIIIGTLQIVGYITLALGSIIFLNTYRFYTSDGYRAYVDPSVAWALLVPALHVTFGSLLVHGARTSNFCLVVSWVSFHCTITGMKTVGFLIGLLVVRPTTSVDWRILLVVFISVAALLAVEWWFFVVGLTLTRRLSQRKGAVLTPAHPVVTVTSSGHQQHRAEYSPQQPPQPEYPSQQAPQPDYPSQGAPQPEYPPQQAQYPTQKPQNNQYPAEHPPQYQPHVYQHPPQYQPQQPEDPSKQPDKPQ